MGLKIRLNKTAKNKNIEIDSDELLKDYVDKKDIKDVLKDYMTEESIKYLLKSVTISRELIVKLMSYKGIFNIANVINVLADEKIEKDVTKEGSLYYNKKLKRLRLRTDKEWITV